jgi:hypothetical protein
MSCIVYTVNYNSYNLSVALTTYKYNEFQVSNATQELNCKAIAKHPFFS